jgi:hypothetical protein
MLCQEAADVDLFRHNLICYVELHCKQMQVDLESSKNLLISKACNEFYINNQEIKNQG